MGCIHGRYRYLLTLFFFFLINILTHPTSTGHYSGTLPLTITFTPLKTRKKASGQSWMISFTSSEGNQMFSEECEFAIEVHMFCKTVGF